MRGKIYQAIKLQRDTSCFGTSIRTSRRASRFRMKTELFGSPSSILLFVPNWERIGNKSFVANRKRGFACRFSSYLQVISILSNQERSLSHVLLRYYMHKDGRGKS
jgi:hypothetical protein